MPRLLLLALFLALPAAAQTPAERDAVQSVIAAQLDAFRHDDADRAFGYAAPEIQHLFGDPAHFMAMVRQAYPPVYRPRAVTFEQLAAEGGRLVQAVRLLGPDGKPALAIYTLEQQPDGAWRITSCTLTTPADVAA